jgi:uncharacterized protein with HEPN domain
MLRYCEKIENYIQKFGDSFEQLKQEESYKDATAMCTLQIGELAGHLTDEF